MESIKVTNRQTRIEWIDIVKGIGILCVILGHLSAPNQITRILVYSFHMPLFFFISGYLYKSKDLKKVIINGVKKLLFPVWFFVAFDTVLSFVLSFVAKEPFPLIKDIASAFF